MEGIVYFAATGKPFPGVEIVIVESGATTVSAENGRFVFEGLQPGSYTLQARAQSFSVLQKQVLVRDGAATRVEFRLSLSPLSENVVVTASPTVQETFRTYQPTGALAGEELAQRLSGTLAETLKDQSGVNLRSFGPGSARPVIRGFDGDRVLVLQDGNRTGDLGSQSGDHGVPIDPASLERIEVVRGPASLLYGSNAIGGVVNTVTTEVGHTAPFKGVMGHVNLEAGTVNNEAAANGHIDVGTGPWIFHAGGGGRRSSDYDTPQGEVPNSGARTANAQVAFDHVANRGSVGLSYGHDDLLFGLPFAGLFEGEEDARIEFDMRRHLLQFRGEARDFEGPLQKIRFRAGYTDYRHQELEDSEVKTIFRNRLFEYQGFLEQKTRGRLNGSLGFWGVRRDYSITGDEVLAPPTIQNSFALFAYEEVAWERFQFQFGARYDHTSYDTTGLPDRSFNGFSGSLGILADLRPDTVLAASYALAYRAPALEELYNNGPHIGSLRFEIGNTGLKRELGNGLDLSLRHRQERVRGEVNFFYNRIRDFIFGAPTGDVEDNLPVYDFTQGDARFVGFEAELDFALVDWLWMNLGADYVHAKLLESGLPLPRIPPLRGRAGLEFRHLGLSFSPQLVMVSDQERLFGPESRTAGYTVLNLRAAYQWTHGRHQHAITASLLNAGDRLYRNHLSFIKDFAPEYGRSFKVTYTLSFF